MVVGALLVLAPAAGAEEEKVEDANNTAKFDIVFDEETGLSFDDKGTEATDDDTTTFTYTLERDPLSPDEADNALSHMLAAGFCVEPSDVEPDFTANEGNKWDSPDLVTSGQVYEITFPGDYREAVDPEGSTWTLKKGQDERSIKRAGPDCDPGEDPDPDPDPATLTVTKVVTGEVPDEWSFPFTVTDGDGFSLTNETEDSDTVSEEVEAGSYTITETDAGDADLVSIECGDVGEEVDLTTASVTVELEAGDDVTCTFTNDFPEVDDNEVPRDPDPTEKPKPTVKPTVTPRGPATEVLGVSVKRTLPATGSSSQTLAFAGLGMLVLGAGLVASTRRMAR